MSCPRSSRLRLHIDAALMRSPLLGSLALLFAASMMRAAPLDDVRVDGTAAPGVIPPSVRGDLDGNGTADLVLRQTQTGDLWLLTTAAGTAQTALANYVPGVPLAWRVAAIADVDGDGKSDLIWQDAVTGDVSVWLMSDGKILRAQFVAFGVPLAWRIVGAADLDGDDKADLVWWHGQTGDVAIWLLDGTLVRANAVIHTAALPGTFQIAKVADVDGDGRADLIWRQVAAWGNMTAWLMNGVSVKQGAFLLSSVHEAWQLQ